MRTDVLVVGAGPAGSAAAAWAAQAGYDVLLADAAVFPRDKTCGDGLTPRAIGELQKLGLEDWLRAHTVNQGLRAHGFGQTLLLPWPGGTLPAWGSAVARTELDDHLRTTAIKAGAEARRRRASGRRTHGRRPGRCRRVRARQRQGRRALRGRLRPARRRRRRALAAGQAARPGVAPRDRVRRRGTQLRRLDDVRRPVDQQPPRAARRAGAGAVGVRLDLPARQRRGERRRRHPGHGQAARRDRDQAADGALRRAAAGGLRARRRAADAHLGAAADGRGGLGRGRRQLGADRRRRRVREPAQRRGHRLRPGVRPAPGGDDGGAHATSRAPGRRCCASTTARRSRSPAASPVW